MVEDNKEIFEISALISRFLLGEITGEEEERLEAWKNESEHNRGLFEELCAEKGSCLGKYSEISSETAFLRFVDRRLVMEKRSRHRLLISRLRYAAVLIFPLIVGAVLWWTIRESVSPTEQLYLSSGSSHRYPTLTLPDGRKVVLDNEKQELQELSGSLFALPDTGSSEYIQNQNDVVGLEYQILTTPAQCDYRFTLSDGTRVWINAASSVKFPVVFSNRERVIYADGEVYLEVAKDASRPFYVVTHDLKIKVLGTSFNVNAYPDENFTAVTLCAGKVKVHTENAEYDLTPDQQLRLNCNTGAVEIKRVNTNDYISWREGRYIFKGQTLEEVAKVLERWYGVKIIFKNTTGAAEVYTGIVFKEEDVLAFMERLNATSCVFAQKQGNVIYIQ